MIAEIQLMGAVARLSDISDFSRIYLLILSYLDTDSAKVTLTPVFNSFNKKKK